MSTFTQVFHIPESKSFSEEGFNQYEIALSSGKKFVFRNSLDGKKFAVAGTYWTDVSFEKLIKNYNKGASAVQSLLKETRRYMMFGHNVFTEEEIEEAILMWKQRL